MRSDHSRSAIVAALGTLAWLMTSTPLHASDRDVKIHLQQAFAGADWRDVRIDVDHGVVTLTGDVPHVWAKQQIEQEARRSSGVDRVVNELFVTRASDDASLKDMLEKQIQQWQPGTMFDDVSVSVIGGTAVLVGYLTTSQKLPPLIELVARTPGVQQVVSQMEILPGSAVDEQLRTTIADALHRDADFGDLSAQGTASIHIIVNNARVTLAGIVSSSRQRTRAEEILRGIPGVLSVDNRLLVMGNATR
jgi:osmotically-inducible protein OsmY